MAGELIAACIPSVVYYQVLYVCLVDRLRMLVSHPMRGTMMEPLQHILQLQEVDLCFIVTNLRISMQNAFNIALLIVLYKDFVHDRPRPKFFEMGMFPELTLRDHL